MLVLLYLGEIFISTTSALLNPAAYFLGKMVWFTLTAVAITTPSLCYLHLGLWMGHISSIKSLWQFNRESVNIIYLSLKTSVVKKKIQLEPNTATQFLQLIHLVPSQQYLLLWTYHYCPLLTAGFWLPVAAGSLCHVSSAKCPAASAQGVRDHITFQKQVLMSSAVLWLNGNNAESCWSRAEELRVWWRQCKSH